MLTTSLFADSEDPKHNKPEDPIYGIYERIPSFIEDRGNENLRNFYVQCQEMLTDGIKIQWEPTTDNHNKDLESIMKIIWGKQIDSTIQLIKSYLISNENNLFYSDDKKQKQKTQEINKTNTNTNTNEIEIEIEMTEEEVLTLKEKLDNISITDNIASSYNLILDDYKTLMKKKHNEFDRLSTDISELNINAFNSLKEIKGFGYMKNSLRVKQLNDILGDQFIKSIKENFSVKLKDEFNSLSNSQMTKYHTERKQSESILKKTIFIALEHVMDILLWDNNNNNKDIQNVNENKDIQNVNNNNNNKDIQNVNNNNANPLRFPLGNNNNNNNNNKILDAVKELNEKVQMAFNKRMTVKDMEVTKNRITSIVNSL